MSQVTERFHGGSCCPTLLLQGKTENGVSFHQERKQRPSTEQARLAKRKMAQGFAFPRELPAQQSSWLSKAGKAGFQEGKPAAASVSLALDPESCLLPLQRLKTGQETVRLPYVEKGKEGKCPPPEEEANASGSRIMCQKCQYCSEDQSSQSPGR